MNTVVGLACAVGYDMSFNSKHHNEEQTIKTPIHVHANGHKHEHNNEANKHKNEGKKASTKDDCCNDKVVKFQNVEKNLSPKTIFDAPAFVAILSTFFGTELYNITKDFPHKNIARFFYPPPLDILISIQKFQV